MFSAFIDFLFSLLIYKSKVEIYRRIYLITSIGINLGLLLYFKYAYFILDNTISFASIFGIDINYKLPDIILPLGISFYTFLSISYTIDVYRREFKPINNFLLYLTYVMYWPHMIAGPILRAKELIPQLEAPQNLRFFKCVKGIRYIIFGLFLKVVLGDQLAPWVDESFSTNIDLLSSLDVWTMAFAFGLQIYFDFAGYSMIAVGSAYLFGIKLPNNFNWPYLSTSPREFWQRWHITLSFWIRDYLYIPLLNVISHKSTSKNFSSRSRVFKSKLFVVTVALFLSWMIMGLWHGAAWKFALWGFYHAVVITCYRFITLINFDFNSYFKKFLGWVVTLPLMMLGWIPFRASDLTSSLDLFRIALTPAKFVGLAFRENFYLITFIFMVFVLARFFLFNVVINRMSLPTRFIIGIIEMAICLSAIFIFLRPVSQFIYFQF